MTEVAPRLRMLLILALGVLSMLAAAVASARIFPRWSQTWPPFSPDPILPDALGPNPPTRPAAQANVGITIPPVPPPGANVPPALEVEGTLRAIGPSEMVIEVLPSRPDFTLTLSPQAFVYLGGEPVSWRELPYGADVRVTYELRGDERLATRVMAVPPGQEVPPPVLEPKTIAPPVPGAEDLPHDAPQP